jgi:hypothetical protein
MKKYVRIYLLFVFVLFFSGKDKEETYYRPVKVGNEIHYYSSGLQSNYMDSVEENIHKTTHYANYTKRKFAIEFEND